MYCGGRGVDVKKLTKVLKHRVDKKTFGSTKEKDIVFLAQSLSRFNSILGETYTEENIPDHYSSIIAQGMEILYLKNIIFKELRINQKEGINDQVGALLTVLNHLENTYLQEIQLVRRED